MRFPGNRKFFRVTQQGLEMRLVVDGKLPFKYHILTKIEFNLLSEQVFVELPRALDIIHNDQGGDEFQHDVLLPHHHYSSRGFASIIIKTEIANTLQGD